MTTRPVWLLILAIAIGTTMAAAQGDSADWPQWRGQNRDGAAGSFAEPPAWPEQLTMKWKAEVGLGYAAPITVANRVYMFTGQEPNEVMRALDADTGRILWETEYPAPFTPNPAAVRRHGTGPKSTPAFANGRLHTLGMSGIVSAFDAATGKLLWQKPAPPVEPLYHTAMSPIVDRGLVIVHVGGHNSGALTAFDAASGEVKWSWPGDGPSYGSPIVADLGGTRQVITMTQENIVGVAAATGELLWRRAFPVRVTRNAVTPILLGDTIIFSGLERSVYAVRPEKRGSEWVLADVWENPDVTMDMSTGVVMGGTLFGFSGRNAGQFFAIDAKSGRTLWLTEGRQADNAAVVRAGNVWLALEHDGELVIARPDPAKFDPLKRYTVAQSETWAQPVVSGSRILIKDVSSVALWALN